MKKFLFLFFLLYLACLATGEKLGVLSGIVRQPQLLEASEGKLYVIDDSRVLIYSAKDLQLIKKFGQEGDGPGELRAGHLAANTLYVQPEYLLVSDTLGDMPGIRKIVYFSHAGKYIKEKKFTRRMFRVSPVGKNFVVNRLVRDERGNDMSVLTVCDADFNIKKELCRQEVSENPKKFFAVPDTIQFAVHNEKIYLENSKKGFIVEVYDPEGNLLSTIKKDIKPVKISDVHKKRFMEEFKADPLISSLASRMGGIKECLKRFNLLWPESLPPIKDIIVTGNYIYLQTYIEKDNKTGYIIMDIKGKKHKFVFLPKVMLSPLTGRVIGTGLRYFDIENDKFYYIVENEDEEEWEVHVEAIK